jgi:hypothetical protein
VSVSGREAKGHKKKSGEAMPWEIAYWAEPSEEDARTTVGEFDDASPGREISARGTADARLS